MDLVGHARTAQEMAGMSIPYENIPTFTMTCVTPLLIRSMISQRDIESMAPSMCSAAIPACLNWSARWMECLIEEANTMVCLPWASLNQCVTMSPTSLGLSIRASTSSAL